MSPHGLSEAHSNSRVEIYVGVHDQATTQLVAPSDPTGPDSPLPRLHYNVSQHQIRKSTRGSLVDRGANGGIIGNDARVIHEHFQEVDVTGIDNHQINALKMVDAVAKATSQHGDVILVMRQYAYHGHNRTIHSSGQIEHYQNQVHDKSMKIKGGRQCIVTLDGYILPIDIINGLPFLPMYPPTDEELATLPQVLLTSGDQWNPKVLDNKITDTDDWVNKLKDLDDGMIVSPFDSKGEYKQREPRIGHKSPAPQDDPSVSSADDSSTADADLSDSDDDLSVGPFDLNVHVAFGDASDLNVIMVPPDTPNDFDLDDLEPPSDDDDSEDFLVNPHEVHAPEQRPRNKDYTKYRPYFLHVPDEKIRKTFENTTQWATNVMSGNKIQQTIKAPFPAHNVPRRHEPVASDTVYAEVPAIGTGGQTMAQMFIGRNSLVSDAHGMANEREFVNTLLDTIRERGAMDKLITDSATVEISKQVIDVCRALLIQQHQTEPNYQHQDFAEHRYRHIKGNLNWYMNYRAVPPEAWLLCLKWICAVMNMTAEKSLGWRTPLEVLTGQTTDISIALCFLFWDVVYVSRYKDSQYSGQPGSEQSSEVRGRFVGFADHVGHALTFLVLTDDTKKIIPRSRLRLANETENNLKLEIEAGAAPERVYIKSKRDKDGDKLRLPTIDMNFDPFRVVEDEVPLSQKGEPMKDTPPKARDTPTVETVEEPKVDKSDDKDAVDMFAGYRSPMENPPLKDMPAPDLPEPEDLPPHLRDQGVNEDKTKPEVEFILDSLKTPNPVQPNLPPDELIDRTFLMPPKRDGTRYRAKIIERIQEHKKKLDKNPELIRFRCLVNGDHEKIVAYNDVVDYIEQDQSWDGMWKFKRILDHHSPVKPRKDHDYSRCEDKDVYKGSTINVLVEWESGETTWEPLHRRDKTGVFDTDPVTVAIYAKENGLLKTPGWKSQKLLNIAKTQKRLIRRANQAKLHSYRTKPVYMYGFQVPRNYEQALEFDRLNGNTRWADATALELGQVDEYETFKDIGKGGNPGPGYKKINVHLVYAVKHDGRHKARLVAGGHLTDTPLDSVYSSVVSLRGVRILAFIAELNKLELWATDIGNAYLESYTQEKVYIIAGPEFGEREGHTLIIVRALYGLKSSGLRWHQRFADVLRNMGFTPSKAEPDIWMRNMGDHYEYIAVYVDDLMILSKKPQALIDELVKKYNFKLKGTGKISFHLGCDFFYDDEGVLCFAPRKYIQKICDNYQRIFGTQPKQVQSPLVKGDHPELDSSELLDHEDTKIYQSLIGGLQWTVQIGRFDVSTAVMTMSRFRAAPRKGHMDRVKRIHGYLSKMRYAVIRILTEEPDFSQLESKTYDWEYTCYHGAREEIPDDIPTPLGRRVILSHYFDANLFHDLISGRSVTGILHFANKTPIDWFSKMQSTVETATFGSEYVAARTCTEQIIDLRTTFRYLGVPVEGSSYVFGDNETVVNTATVPHSKLHKRHNALSYHKTREAIAAGVQKMFHLPGTDNPADILSKHWDYPAVRSQLKPLLFSGKHPLSEKEKQAKAEAEASKAK